MRVLSENSIRPGIRLIEQITLSARKITNINRNDAICSSPTVQVAVPA